MKWIAGVLVAGLLCGAVGLGQETAADELELEDLSWLAGSWKGKSGKTEQEEFWILPKGGIMLGLHRDVTPGRPAFFEYLRIEQTKKGIAYVASPRGRGTTAFPLKELAGERVVFENKDHDFPQRILYWLEGADTLIARIEGEVNGSPRASQWEWERLEEE